MKVLELKLKEEDVIRVITPKFVFTSNFSITHLAFFVYHDTSHEFYGEKRIRLDHDLVFYPLNESKFLFRTRAILKGHQNMTILLKKVLVNRCLYFEVEINLKNLPKEEYDLSPVSDRTHSDLDWIYTYLEMFSHKSINGSFVGSRKEETQQTVVAPSSQNNSKLVRKNTNVMVIVLILFCVGISPFVLFWVRKTYLTKKKLRFQKEAKSFV